MRAALCRVLLSDCHYFNLGVRITSGATEHEVVIIDAGSKGLADSVPAKSEVNKSMRNLWNWSRVEIQASPASTRDIWQYEHTLEAVAQRLDRAWALSPFLTSNRVSTSFIDFQVTGKCSMALREFTQSPRGKLVELIARSSVEWSGGAWSDRLSECCMLTVEAHTTFDPDEDEVLTELYQRITMDRTKMRTKEEVEAIVAFWWKLQTYRRRYLERKGRFDSAEEVLSDTDIMKVRRDWEDWEIWWDLSAKQKRNGHLPSIYNAALHNRSGWATVANAVIKYQLPQLRRLRRSDGVTEHIQIINRFSCDLLEWMKIFAGAALAYWRSADYQRARATSGVQTLRWTRG